MFERTTAVLAAEAAYAAAYEAVRAAVTGSVNDNDGLVEESLDGGVHGTFEEVTVFMGASN